MLRPHGTVRIYDTEHWTFVFGSAYRCDGGHRQFRIDYFRREPNSKRHGVTIPKFSFMTCFRFKRVGGLAVYRVQSLFLSRLATNPVYRAEMYARHAKEDAR